MKPPAFDYYRAESVAEAAQLLADFNGDAKVLGGGQSLIPLLSLRMANPAALVDINEIPELALKMFTGGELVIGATVRHRAVESDPRVARFCTAVADAVPMIGHTAIRNRGTVAGSVAHADPAAEWPVLMTLLDGAVDVTSVRGDRRIAAADFFGGYLTTALGADEIVTGVRLPAPSVNSGTVFREFARRSGDFALVSMGAVIVLTDDGRIEQCRIAVGGVASVPVRAAEAEALLAGERPTPDAFAAAADAVAAPLEPAADLNGDAEFRRTLTRVLAARTLPIANQRAKESMEVAA